MLYCILNFRTHSLLWKCVRNWTKVWRTAIVCWILAITVTKGRLQTLKRKFKLIPSSSRPKLFNFDGSKLFQRFCICISKWFVNFSAKIFWCSIFISFFWFSCWYLISSAPPSNMRTILFLINWMCCASKKVKISKAKHKRTNICVSSTNDINLDE